MNECNDPDHGAINAERSESRCLRKAWIELDDKRQQLERELTAARSEIAQIKAILANPVAVHSNLLRGTIAWTPEHLRHILGDYSELTAVTEQRDGLRSGIDYASDQLHKVTEQRDRLAEVLRNIMAYRKGEKPHDYWRLPFEERENAAFDVWMQIENSINQALQSLDQSPNNA